MVVLLDSTTKDSLGGPSWGVHADLVTSEIIQCQEFSVNWLSVNCLLIPFLHSLDFLG